MSASYHTTSHTGGERAADAAEADLPKPLCAVWQRHRAEEGGSRCRRPACACTRHTTSPSCMSTRWAYSSGV
jgi:hypothetical protein